MAENLNQLKLKRAAYKGKVTSTIRLLTPLLNLTGAEAKNKFDRVTDIYKKFDTAVAKFKDYHAKYSEIVEGETDEADLARVVEELDNYADEVEKS